jgi:uncharacterized protein (TIGR01777 family)
VKAAITGASGLVGSRVVAALRERGDEALALPRDLAGRREALATGVDAVLHLAGENVAQRWTATAKERIRASRVEGTRELVEALREAAPRPQVLVSASASGYYGPRGDEPVDESAGPGEDFLAGVVVGWEREADAAAELGMRVVKLRTGVVLDRNGGALAKMLPPFKLGVGGPVAGGDQYLPWIHVDDVVGMYMAALDNEAWAGPVNASAPEPVTNREFSKALGRALRRPAILPVPALALKALYGDMAQIVTTGVRMVPARARALGYSFQHPDLDEALQTALA